MRCEIAASLLHQPRLLFLDEPTIGLDAVSKLAVREFILKLNREHKTTVILTTHDMQDIEALTNRVILIGRGKVLLDGNLEDMRCLAVEVKAEEAAENDAGLDRIVAASVTALLTQFLWGAMECMAFKVLLESNAASAPMGLSAVISYIWLKEDFFALFTVWATDNDIFDMIMDGGIAYEMCRPVSVYNMWYTGSIIPLPFIPYPVRGILELLPFASMMNVPLRIYSGNLSGADMLAAVCLQLFWLAVLVAAGKLVCCMAERRIVVQGG